VNGDIPAQPAAEDDWDQWFRERVQRLAQCPCCGYHSLTGRGQCQICPVCFWDDDDHEGDTAHHGTVHRGANGALSLAEAQRNFDVFGAVHERYIYDVRPPSDVETPADGSARVLPETARRKRRRPDYQR
jgi:hypothetical protein